MLGHFGFTSGALDMVTSITNFGRSGVSDWLIQRASAIVLVAYTLFIFGFLWLHPDLTFQDWQAFFANSGVKIFSLLALLSLCAHAWIGLWCVTTDYITTRLLGAKATALRLAVQSVCALVTFIYFVWGVQILWGF